MSRCSRTAQGVTASILTACVMLGSIGAVTADSAGGRSYHTLEWIDLLPPEDLEALLNPPEALSAIEDGSAEDQFSPDGGLPGSFGDSDVARRFEAALQSTTVRGEFDGTQVRIPGFVVPLAFDETRMISEFFLVPYFGACLHTPPPPPNQIIHSKFAGGLSLDDIYEPYWLEGTLTVELEETDLGTAAYRIDVDRMLRYEER